MPNHENTKAKVFTLWVELVILPLTGVFIMAYAGISVMKAIKLTKLNLLTGKILLGLFFIALAVLMMFA